MQKCKERTVILAYTARETLRRWTAVAPSNCAKLPLGQVRAIYLMKSPWVTVTFLRLKPSVQVERDCGGCDHCGYCMRYSNGTERLLYPGPGAELSTLSSRTSRKPHAIGIIIRCLFQMRKLTRREGRYFAGRPQS